MEPTHYGAITDLLVQLFSQMALKLLARPKGLVSSLWIPGQALIFGALFRGDLTYTNARSRM